MPKRPMSPDALPAPKRRDASFQDTTIDMRPSFNLLYDEIVLVIFSFLSHTDLCAIQPTSRNWSRLALDNQLWKRLYLTEYGRSRLRGVRGFIGRQDGREIKPLPSRVKLEDTEDTRDWKWMFRISSNWRNGRCSVQRIPSHPGPTDLAINNSNHRLQTQVILVGAITITTTSQNSQRCLLLASPGQAVHVLSCHTARSTAETAITALALDQSPPPTTHQVRLGVFLSTGEFIVFSIDHIRPANSKRLFTYLPIIATPRTTPIIQAVFHENLIVTLSQSFHLSLYDLSGGTAKHTQTLSSFTSYPPSSLVLTPVGPTKYKLILAYAIPVYPIHWSVGATELMISSELSGMVAASTRTIRAFDVPSGWIDEQKLRAMREQWGRKVARVADTQTDGKWVVLAPADAPPAPAPATGAAPHPTASSHSASSLQSPSSLQLYRLQFPSSTATSATPKLTFVRTLHGQIGPCSALALADGRCVSLGVNGSIWVWDLEGGTGAEVYHGRSISSDTNGPVNAVKGTVVFDERRIISADSHGVEVRRFDI